MTHLANQTTKALVIAIVVNLGFLFIELGIGLFTGSLALLSDAAHMTGDVCALLVALVAHKLSVMFRKKGKSSYRFEIGGAMLNSTALIVGGVFVANEGFHRLAVGHLPTFGWAIAFVGLAGFIVNVVSFFILTKGNTKDLNIKAALAHLKTDALGSVGAVVASLFIIFGYPIADVIIAIVLSAFMLFSGCKILLQVYERFSNGKVDLKHPCKQGCFCEPAE